MANAVASHQRFTENKSTLRGRSHLFGKETGVTCIPVDLMVQRSPCSRKQEGSRKAGVHIRLSLFLSSIWPRRKQQRAIRHKHSCYYSRDSLLRVADGQYVFQRIKESRVFVGNLWCGREEDGIRLSFT